MVAQGRVRKLLVVGLDPRLTQWLRSIVAAAGVPWRVRTVDPLRIGTPDCDLLSHDLVLMQWIPLEPVSLDDLLHRTVAVTRSPEGVLLDLDLFGGEDFRHKTAAISFALRREDTVLLGEQGVRHVISLPIRQALWDAEASSVIRRLQKILEFVDQYKENEAEREVSRFLMLLKSWGSLSDEVRMDSTDKLLAVLGDSARYAELMARKSFRENDMAAAERWLLRGIGKNPNYMQAMTMLAQVYMQSKRFADALAILKKVHLSSPRHLDRIAQMGDCLVALGEYDKAEKMYQEALKIDEFHSSAREGLGKVKCVQGDYQSARTLLANTRNQRDLAVFLNLLGVQFVEKKQFEQAISHYKNAQFVLPSNDQGHQVFFNIALAYLKWGRVGNALSYAKLAVIRDPRYEKAARLVEHIEKQLHGHLGTTPRVA
jgi:tetratricopeptide (TPR) repeat protein